MAMGSCSVTTNMWNVKLFKALTNLLLFHQQKLCHTDILFVITIDNLKQWIGLFTYMFGHKISSLTKHLNLIEVKGFITPTTQLCTSAVWYVAAVF